MAPSLTAASPPSAAAHSRPTPPLVPGPNPPPTPRSILTPRLITAFLALAGAAGLGIFATIAGTDSTSPAGIAHNSRWLIPGLLALGGFAVLALALAIPHPGPVLFGLALLGAAYLVGLPASGPWRSLTAFAGGWLLAVAELTYWSIDFKVRGQDSARIYARRSATIAGLVAAGIALAVIPEIDLGQAGLGGVELTAAGLVAAAALIAVAAGLAWRLRPARPASPRGTSAGPR
jgi:hypothetical protein